MTLVEVAVAALLTLVLSLGLLQMNLSARMTMKRTRVMMEATNALQTYMEQVKNTNYAALADQNFAGVTVSSAGTVPVTDDITGNVAIDVTDNGNDTKTIVGTLTWNEHAYGGAVARSLTFTTLVSEP